MNRKKPVVRFPPSPTGFLHIGGARTALFNYLFARRSGGSFLLRIEDTDKERSKKEYEEDIFDMLRWLGLSYDNKEIVRQSERTHLYREHLKRLMESGRAYLSKEEAGEGKRTLVIRFKNPNKRVSWKDLIRGEVSFDTSDLGDFVVAKSLEEPLYHLAVVADDALTGITHVIRGEDHISNTPRQILLIEALGFPLPEYAHIPLILARDRAKLSKRHGATALRSYLEQGYLPEAVVNYLALLGWNPGTDREIFNLAELAEQFDLSKVQKGGAIFDIEKLNWFNRQYRKLERPEQAVARLKNFMPADKFSVLEKNYKMAELIMERVSVLGELKPLFDAGEFDYFFADPEYAPSALVWKGQGSAADAKSCLKEVRKLLEKIPESGFNKETVKAAIWPYAEKAGRGEVLWPLRVALSGRDKSPDPFTLSEVLGREATLRRLAGAVNLLS